jgi:ATP-dependent RNA helicase DDX56/DBP9
LKHVPEYLLPKERRKSMASSEIGFLGKKIGENGTRKPRMGSKFKGRGKKSIGRKTDPLKTFKAKSRK